MKTALICVLIAGLMPYLWTAVAKVLGPRYDNRNVREWQARLTGVAQRAHAAHLNSFEAFPLFAAAVFAALIAGADSAITSQLSSAVVGVRILYGLAYLADLPRVRSSLWFIALIGIVSLLILAVSRIDS